MNLQPNGYILSIRTGCVKIKTCQNCRKKTRCFTVERKDVHLLTPAIWRHNRHRKLKGMGSRVANIAILSIPGISNPTFYCARQGIHLQHPQQRIFSMVEAVNRPLIHYSLHQRRLNFNNRFNLCSEVQGRQRC